MNTNSLSYALWIKFGNLELAVWLRHRALYPTNVRPDVWSRHRVLEMGRKKWGREGRKNGESKSKKEGFATAHGLIYESGLKVTYKYFIQNTLVLW